MFQFFFRYPARVFSQGNFVLLGGWPKWVLGILLLGAAAALGWRIYSRVGRASQHLKYWQAAVIWLLESAAVCLVLILLWQPAIVVAELKPQQNVIAVLIDDSRSMGINEDGSHSRAAGQAGPSEQRAGRAAGEISDSCVSPR